MTETVDIKELRVAFFTDNGIITPSKETIKTVENVVQFILDEKISIEEAKPKGIDASHALFTKLAFADGGASVQRLLQKVGTIPPSNDIGQKNTSISSSEFIVLLERWDFFRSRMLTFWQNYDVLLSPVNAYSAVMHGELSTPLPVACSYTMSFNLTGWPSTVVRCGTSNDGLPIGLQVIAPPWREDISLAVAKVLEQSFGGWQTTTL